MAHGTGWLIVVPVLIIAPVYVIFLVAIYRYRQHCLKSPYFKVLRWTSVSDLVNLSSSTFIYRLWWWPTGGGDPLIISGFAPRVELFIVTTSGFISFWFISVIAVNRLHALVKPITYEQFWEKHITRVLSIVVFGVCWLSAPILLSDVEFNQPGRLDLNQTSAEPQLVSHGVFVWRHEWQYDISIFLSYLQFSSSTFVMTSAYAVMLGHVVVKRIRGPQAQQAFTVTANEQAIGKRLMLIGALLAGPGIVIFVDYVCALASGAQPTWISIVATVWLVCQNPFVVSAFSRDVQGVEKQLFVDAYRCVTKCCKNQATDDKTSVVLKYNASAASL